MTEYGSAAGTQHRGVEQLRDLEVGKRSTTSTTRSDLVTRFAIYNWYRSESRSLDLPTADWFFLDQILVIRIFRARKFLFSCCEPYSGIRAVFMRRSVARVEHNGFVGVDAFVVVSLSCTLHLAGWWDEAARTDITRRLTREWFRT